MCLHNAHKEDENHKVLTLHFLPISYSKNKTIKQRKTDYSINRNFGEEFLYTTPINSKGTLTPTKQKVSSKI